MIKVKIERPTDNVHLVEDGYTVQYDDDVLQVLNDDDEVIAIFRDWVYARPAVDSDYEEEAEEDEVWSPATQAVLEHLSLPDRDVELAEVVVEVPENASSAHANSHGAYEVVDGESEGPAS